jgi:hypothetical protein
VISKKKAGEPPAFQTFDMLLLTACRLNYRPESAPEERSALPLQRCLSLPPACFAAT